MSKTETTASDLDNRPKVTITHDETGWLITCGDAELSAKGDNMLAVLCGTLMQDDILQRKELRRLKKLDVKLTKSEVDDLLEKWDETNPELQREITAVILYRTFCENKQLQTRIEELEKELLTAQEVCRGAVSGMKADIDRIAELEDANAAEKKQ